MPVRKYTERTQAVVRVYAPTKRTIDTEFKRRGVSRSMVVAAMEHMWIKATRAQRTEAIESAAQRMHTQGYV